MSYTVRMSGGDDKSFDSFMDARRAYTDQMWKFRSAGAGKVDLLLGEEVKETFDVADDADARMERKVSTMISEQGELMLKVGMVTCFSSVMFMAWFSGNYGTPTRNR